MVSSPLATRTVRFGVFELDCQTGELRRQGVKLRLQGQPIEVLRRLLETPGELVTREDLRKRLWPADTFVDFDQALNNSVQRIREALGDSAQSPRFIETIPRRGYRFIGPVENGVSSQPVAPTPTQSISSSHRVLRREFPRPFAAIFILGILFTSVLVIAVRWRNTQTVPIRSIAVLPFQNLTGDSGQEYLVDGITDELITKLAQAGLLRVTSRTTSMQYKNIRRPLPQIAQTLKVDAILEGSVSRSGNRVRITAQLVRSSDDRHLWAQDYERDMADILALQAEIARQIANETGLRVAPGSAQLLKQRVSEQAQDLYLRGRFFYEKRTVAATRMAMEYFKQAIALQPDYAQAYAALADCYVMGGATQGLTPEMYLELKAAADHAINLDPTLALPHLALARGAAWLSDGESAEIEREFETALHLDPNSAIAYEWRGMYRWWNGRLEEMLSDYQRALLLDPASPRLNARLGQGLAELNRFDEAIKQLNRALEMDSNLWITHTVLGDVYMAQGRWADAIREYKKAEQLNGTRLNELPDEEVLVAVALSMAGNHRAAAVMLQKLATQPLTKEPRSILAALNIAAGNRGRALQILKDTCSHPGRRCELLLAQAAFASVRDDRTLQDVVARGRGQ